MVPICNKDSLEDTVFEDEAATGALGGYIHSQRSPDPEGRRLAKPSRGACVAVAHRDAQWEAVFSFILVLIFLASKGLLKLTTLHRWNFSRVTYDVDTLCRVSVMTCRISIRRLRPKYIL